MQRRGDEVSPSKIYMGDDNEGLGSTYQSVLNERGSYPSTLLKPRATSVPLHREAESAYSLRKPKTLPLAEKTQRVSFGKLSHAAHDKEIPKVSPLLGRYKQMERSTTHRNIENTHQSTSSISPVSVNDSKLQKNFEHKQRTMIPCPQDVRQSTEGGGLGTESRRETIMERKVCNVCPDDFCIHSRHTIIEYVDLKKELRECYSSLQEQGAEIEELRSQIQSLQEVKDELELQLQAKTDNIVAESTKDFQRMEEEWKKQECNLKQSVKDLGVALEQERLDHSRCQNELESVKEIHLQTKQNMKRLQDTFDAFSMHAAHRDFVGHSISPQLINIPSVEKLSTVSLMDTPTPRRRPPSLPLGLGVDADLMTTANDSVPHARALYSTQSNVTNAVESTLINVSDPSLAPCDQSNNISMQTNLVEEGELCHLVKKMDVGDGDGITQRETEEGTTEGDGQTSSGDLRNPALMCDFSSPSNSQPQDPLFSVHPSLTHPFDHLAGQESLLCKELLRALLDKEKQLAEVVLERKALKEELALLTE